MKSNTMRRIAAPLSLGLLVGLGGCGPVNRSLYSVHQPTVSRSDVAIDVGTAPNGLARGEAERLSGWFEVMHLGYGDRVAITDPAPYGHARGRDVIAGLAAQYGLLVGTDAPVTEGAIPANAIRIVVTRSAARVDGCPDWRRMSQPNLDESTSSNYGCAVNTNVAAMVANPEDLVRGQPGAASSDADTAVKAIKSYRETDPTGKAGLPGGNKDISVVKTGGN